MTELLHYGADPAEASRIVIGVHGRGQGAVFMHGIAALVDDPGLHWMLPEAPGATWYPAQFMEPYEANQPQLDAGLDRIDALLAEAVARGAEPSRIAVVGFSQGACLLAHHLLTRPGIRGPVALLTGGFIGPAGTVVASSRSLEGQTVYMEAADDDPWVPLGRVHETLDALRAAGADARLDVREGNEHHVPESALAAVRALLAG
ncbi:alpha/beta hydrolase [Microcella flavibacter]|uniref:alpha/beta hydrolase n=1 Tax=Microcella flavibacter TaxID=1804990 RepID=UPI0014575425|nr:dienelactone hydrolase family protein [Microcella flavibacter]